VLLDTSCNPPCWHQIIPGKSVESDVISILENVPEVNPELVSYYSSQYYGTTSHVKLAFDDDAGDIGGWIYFMNGVVFMMDFGPKKGALTLEDAIQLLGEPEFTYAYKEIGETQTMIILLLYPSKGYIILYNIERFRRDSAIIQPEHSIQSVMYFDPSQLNEVITSGLIIGQDIATVKQQMRPWEGYGEVYYFEVEWE
jgi:hypothetical protein